MDTVKKKKGTFVPMDKPKKQYFVKSGLLCGVALCAASLLQQFGIDRGTASGKAGFITALYILMVPIFSAVLRKRIRPIIWPCAAAAVVGLYLLCVKGGFTVQSSDFYVLGCAVVYAIHILIIDHVSPHVDGVSGATFTTNAIRNAVNAAAEQAGCTVPVGSSAPLLLPILFDRSVPVV